MLLLGALLGRRRLGGRLLGLGRGPVVGGVVKLRFASRERRQFHRVCKATRARGGVDRCGGLRRLSFEMCGARGHAYVMITPQQCLAGLFFLAAALALVGFLGLFFAMAHVRLVIPLARIAKVLRARVTALPNSRAALCLFYFFSIAF